jgi:hypothetical protein
MSGSVVGDTGELVKKTIVAKATHTVTGTSGSFHFSLSAAPGISKYFTSHARVVITGPVSITISGPTSATVASTATVAIIPDKYPDFPTTEAEVIELQGSIRVQHSLIVGAEEKVVSFGHETTEQLKPRTLIDYPPVVVGHYTIAGGTATSTALIVISCPLTVDGVAHHKTW